MRKNKKLLLGGLSVLTLVAAGSGAVSTFAWFTANASVNKTRVADSSSFSVEHTNTTVSGVKFTVSNAEDHTTLVLTNNTGKTGYMNGATPVGNLPIPGDQYGYCDITATVTLSLQTPSGDDDADTAALQTAIGALDANDHCYVAAIPTSAQNKLRLSTSTTANAQYADAAVMATVWSEIDFTQTAGTWATSYTAHFYVSIVGNTAGADNESNFTDLSVNVTCGSVSGEPAAFTPYTPAA